MEAGDRPIDMGRLTKPEADAFRHIAEALGARFAGDLPDLRAIQALPAARVEPTRFNPAPRASSLELSQSDPRAETLLDRVPIAILVIVGDNVAFMNRAAAGLFGYTSAAILDAAGGLGALFDGQDCGQAGVLNMVAATGARFAARVTMASTDWCGARAMMFTVVPSADVPSARPAEAEPKHREGRDPLVALLDANPDPIAIVTRGGHVEACNVAFQNLGGMPDTLRLDDRLLPGDLRHVFDVMQLSFFLSDGAARTTQPIRVGGDSFSVTVGALKNGRLACLVFHKVGHGEAAGLTRPPSPPANDVEAVARPGRPEPAAGERVADAGATPLWQAVREVRRLVRDAAILVVSDGEESGGDARPAREREAETQLLRFVLVAVAARASAGTVITVRRRAADYTVTLSPPRPDALYAAANSDRLITLADAAGRTLVLGHDGGLTVSALTVAATGGTRAEEA